MQEIKQTSKQTEPAESIAQHLTLSKNGAFLFWCGNQSLSVHGAAAAIGSTLTMTRYTRTIQNNMDVPFRSVAPSSQRRYSIVPLTIEQKRG